MLDDIHNFDADIQESVLQPQAHIMSDCLPMNSFSEGKEGTVA
jgi:hypothetical protein